MTRLQLYYLVKPLIPPWLRLALRRSLIQSQRQAYDRVWPIDERVKGRPEGWSGWPDDKRFALVLTHDVETAQGQEGCDALIAIEQEMGFRSSFNFVPERYPVSEALRQRLVQEGFEVGVHGLRHDGKLFRSRRIFDERAIRINHYLRKWGAVGFRAPSMHHRLDWIHELDIEYDSSTFDTDPFEPQPDGLGTIFPLWAASHSVPGEGYVELPYTLPQDSTLFVFMQESTIDIWRRKLDWLAEHRGMALLISHPDYMHFGGAGAPEGKYPAERYREFLEYARERYDGDYWPALPREVAHFIADGRRAERAIQDAEARIAAKGLAEKK